MGAMIFDTPQIGRYPDGNQPTLFKFLRGNFTGDLHYRALDAASDRNKYPELLPCVYVLYYRVDAYFRFISQEEISTNTVCHFCGLLFWEHLADGREWNGRHWFVFNRSFDFQQVPKFFLCPNCHYTEYPKRRQQWERQQQEKWLREQNEVNLLRLCQKTLKSFQAIVKRGDLAALQSLKREFERARISLR